MKSESADERASGYEKLIEAVKASPNNLDVRENARGIVGGCHALEPDEAAAVRLRKALLSLLPTTDAPLPSQPEQYDLCFWAAETAVEALRRAGGARSPPSSGRCPGRRALRPLRSRRRIARAPPRGPRPHDARRLPAARRRSAEATGGCRHAASALVEPLGQRSSPTKSSPRLKPTCSRPRCQPPARTGTPMKRRLPAASRRPIRSTSCG